MEITGTVERISEQMRKTRNGDMPVFGLFINEEWYNLGFKRPTCKRGDTVEVQYSVGSFGNTVDNVAIKSQAAVAPGFEEKSKSGNSGAKGNASSEKRYRSNAFPVPLDDGGIAIIRQSALNRAIEVWSIGVTGPVTNGVTNEGERNGGGTSIADLEEIITIARVFEGYCSGHEVSLEERDFITPPRDVREVNFDEDLEEYAEAARFEEVQ